MSLEGLVTPEPEIGGGTAGCAVAELHGQVILVHECRNQRGVFYKIISDGPVEVIAPEVIITGKLVLHGNLEVNGDVSIKGDTSHEGSVEVEQQVDIRGRLRTLEDIRTRQGVFHDPELQF